MRLDIVFGGRPQLWVVLSRKNLLDVLRATDVADAPFSIQSGNARRILEGNPMPASDWRLSLTVDPKNYEPGARLRMASAPGQTGEGRAFVDIGRDTIQVLLDSLDEPGSRRDYAVRVDQFVFGWQMGIHVEDDQEHYRGRTPGEVFLDDGDKP